MSTALDTAHISALLHQLDPMRTGCAENPGMEDEYDHQAEAIAERVARGEDPRAATVAVFDFWFWEGCMTEGARAQALDAIVSALTAH